MNKYSDNAMAIYKKLYFERDEKDNLIEKHPIETHERVAKAIADNENQKKAFLEILNRGLFRPNSPVLINSGGPKQCLSACYVLGLEDSMDSIIDCWGTCAKIYASGAGAGVPLTNLRRKDGPITFGGRACLTGDTIIINDRSKLPIEKQERTIEEIYKTYKVYGHLPEKIRCMLDEGLIGTNELIDIIYNGIQRVYRITTEKGYSIKATANHRFLSLKGWKRVDQFLIGSKIGVNGWDKRIGPCIRCGKERILKGKLSKHYGMCDSCAANSYKGDFFLQGLKDSFKRKSKARKKFLKNNSEYFEYMKQINLGKNNPCWKGNQASENTARQRINSLYPWIKNIKECERCNTPADRIEIHHMDGNPYNNELDNLEILCSQCHQSEHAKRNAEGNYRLTKEVFFDKIINIEYVGKEKVYDIQMKKPYHNFIANGFVSHNSGPLSYTKVLDVYSETVKAGNKARRAANMGVLNYDHPDIFDLIDCKLDRVTLKNFNLSVSMTNKFMRNIKNNNLAATYYFIDPKEGTSKETFKGINLWNKIIKNAWTIGDPGLFFVDTTNQWNPFKSVLPIECTNPCGEVPLWPWSECVIGSINVSQMYDHANHLDHFDWNLFKETVKNATLFLDNCIDKTTHPHPKFKETMEKYRPIGLGIMGLADLFVKMKVPYDSPEARLFFSKLCKTMTLTAIEESIAMCIGGKKSIKFPNKDCKDEMYKLISHYTSEKALLNDFKKHGIRNCTWTSIAPTGSIALSADCSYSFEPLSAIVWEKELAETHNIMKFINPEFESWIVGHYGNNGLKIDPIINDIIDNNGSVQGVNGVPEKIQRFFRTAHDIDPYHKIDMQAAGQEYISLAISSTCNLPKDITEKEIGEIFLYAWEKGLKGITVYRDGSHEWQPINFGKKDDSEKTKLEEWIKDKRIIHTIHSINNKLERPIRRRGETFEINTPHGRLYCTFNKDNEGRPLEVFLRLGKSGTLENLLLDTISRLVSKNLQNCVPYKDVSSILRGIKGDLFRFKFMEDASESVAAESIIDAVGIIMEVAFEELKEIKPEDVKITFHNLNAEECPECHQFTLVRTTGCRGGMCENPECLYTSCG